MRSRLPTSHDRESDRDAAVVRERRAAFTLIEILAVVLIIGLLMTLLLPAIGAGSGRALRKQADQVAATLELARQRAIVTGKPHRVVLDLEGGRYWVDWLVTEAQANGESDDDAPPPPEPATTADGTVDLSPPAQDALDYYPLPNKLGRPEPLGQGFFFEGVDTPEGWIEKGEAYVVFDWDGSSDAYQIVLSNPDLRSIDLDVAPLYEVVKIHEEQD